MTSHVLLTFGLPALLGSCAPLHSAQTQAPTTQTTTAQTANSQTTSALRDLPISVLATGTQAAYTDADATNAGQAVRVQLATTPAALSALWHAIYARQSTPPALPALQGQTVVGVFMGTQPTGGYSVQVTRAQASAGGGTLLLSVQTRLPAPGMMTTQALTRPWVIVSVPGQYSRVSVQSAPDTKH